MRAKSMMVEMASTMRQYCEAVRSNSAVRNLAVCNIAKDGAGTGDALVSCPNAAIIVIGASIVKPLL